MLADNPHLVLLFYLSQLFLRELFKSYRLIQVVPMDMSGYYGEYVIIYLGANEIIQREIQQNDTIDCWYGS